MSHLKKFRLISNVSGLSYFIVYVTAFMLLVDKIQGEFGYATIKGYKVSHDQISVVARFENVDLRNASNGCDTTNIQLFCPNLLRNVTNALGYITNTTNDCSSTKWLPPPSNTGGISPNFEKKLFPFWHMICTMLFVTATEFAFSRQSVSMGMVISSVNRAGVNS